jgi:hypothetical protein
MVEAVQMGVIMLYSAVLRGYWLAKWAMAVLTVFGV